MENNYQMFLPCSSSGKSVYPVTSNYVTNSSNIFSHHGDHSSSSSSGLLGLMMKQNILPKTDTVRIISHNGSESEGKKSSTKKGEKKTIKKPRFAFQTRSQIDILDDGYRWRKYGQKAVKNNKFPRSYYRCTHQGCNVKKQIQRLTKDEGIVVTTYEGMHTHRIEKPTDNFEHILNQLQIYSAF
uniref:WRKY transcription factor protein 20 n=1 Tax=Zanthoxylum armatum TaxID=67938 RepID=A0A8F1SZJ0_9ROSI|nr:WRKY transcription factor protein 20 [Zanthoxylum armatum]